MLNPSPKSVSPEKNHLQCFLQWDPHPSITTDWEMLSGTVSMGQKLQQWEGMRAVSRGGSSFIWCNLSCLWGFFCAVEKPRELEDKNVLQVSGGGQIWKTEPEALSQGNAETQVTSLCEQQICQVPATTGWPGVFPFCVIYRIPCCTIKGWFGDEICLKIASNPSYPPTKPSGGAAAARTALLWEREESLLGFNLSWFIQSQSIRSNSSSRPILNL